MIIAVVPKGYTKTEVYSIIADRFYDKSDEAVFFNDWDAAKTTADRLGYKIIDVRIEAIDITPEEPEVLCKHCMDLGCIRKCYE